MLELKNVSIAFEGRSVLKNISFGLDSGDVLSIVGESGVGKTTLLRAISGLVDVEGSILFNNMEVVGPSDKLVAGVENVATVFQDYQLMHNRTVFENIAYPLRSYIEEEQIQMTKQLISILMLEAHRDHYPQELSGGQKQRVAIARALAQEPTLILMDEPFSNLDISLREVVKDSLFSFLKESEITAVLVTHDPNDALSISDQIGVLHLGEIIQMDSPRQIYEQPSNEYVMSCFGMCNFWSAKDFALDIPSFQVKGEEGKFAIRMEDLSTTTNGNHQLKVKVNKSVYQGSCYLISGLTASSNEVYFYHDSTITIGEEVGLTIDEDNVRSFA